MMIFHSYVKLPEGTNGFTVSMVHLLDQEVVHQSSHGSDTAFEGLLSLCIQAKFKASQDLNVSSWLIFADMGWRVGHQGHPSTRWCFSIDFVLKHPTSESFSMFTWQLWRLWLAVPSHSQPTVGFWGVMVNGIIQVLRPSPLLAMGAVGCGVQWVDGMGPYTRTECHQVLATQWSN